MSTPLVGVMRPSMSSGLSKCKERVSRHGYGMNRRSFSVRWPVNLTHPPTPPPNIWVVSKTTPQDCCQCDCDPDAFYDCGGTISAVPYNCLDPTSACGKQNSRPGSYSITIPAAWSRQDIKPSISHAPSRLSPLAWDIYVLVGRLTPLFSQIMFPPVPRYIHVGVVVRRNFLSTQNIEQKSFLRPLLVGLQNRPNTNVFVFFLETRPARRHLRKSSAKRFLSPIPRRLLPNA